jgi:hypothetical protein
MAPKKKYSAAKTSEAKKISTPKGEKKVEKLNLEGSTTKSPKVADGSTVDGLYSLLCDSDDPELIAMEGIGKLCELIGIDSQESPALMLLWRLGAVSKAGHITKDEFIKGMAKIRRTNLDGLKSYKSFLDSGFLDVDEFREFFRFTHIFSREGTKKSLEKELVRELLPIVIDSNRAPHLDSFLKFLEAPESAEFTHISIDAWDSFYVFNKNVHPSLVDYDTEGSWPTILDCFVDWKRKNDKK